jgi:hypothetical protein
MEFLDDGIDTALKLSNYPRVMEFLDDGTKREMANVIKGLIRDLDENLEVIGNFSLLIYLYFL